ncbi:hypothetical protein [Aestuariivirga litoralis]|uniref:hypothetical protein n=1 Tax=Aestuariivirga litoralis TaxID=2650924 RepID=UPI0018C53EED|nr:hypothetical protein [Aestuariivirga litoralis]MBG1230880.1 hypothetical protein [Aestuariivirga litoralis]
MKFAAFSAPNERDWQEILRVTAVIGVLLQAALYYPGFIYFDSFEQFYETQTGHYDDAHPPIMALFWRLQQIVFGTANLFFALQIAAYWLGLHILFRQWPARWWTVLAQLALGFAPFTAQFLGNVWKDIGLGVCAMIACALIMDARFNDKAISFRRGLIIALLIFYGTFVRHNSAFLTAPLILLAFNKWSRIFSWQPLAALALCAALIGVAPFMNRQIMGAENSHLDKALKIYDLGGISQFTQINLLPGTWTEDENNKILNSCYTTRDWNTYRFNFCPFVWAKLDVSNLNHVWLSAIVSHPVAYAYHRLGSFNNFMRFIGPQWGYLYYEKQVPGYVTDKPPVPAPLYSAIAGVLKSMHSYIFFMPYFWFSLLLAQVILTTPMTDKSRQVVNCISVASLAYLLSFLPFGVAANFRYAFPAIVLCCSGFVILIAAHLKGTATPYTRLQKGLLVIPATIIMIGVIF